MKKIDLIKIGSVALATATFTVMTFCLGTSQAGKELTLVPKIVTPKLVANGIELSLASADAPNSKHGNKPAFQLTAVNTTDQPASISVRVAMTATSPADAMSRVAFRPTFLWQQDELVKLQPRETKGFALVAPVQMPTNKMVSVALQKIELTQASSALSASPKGTLDRIVALDFATK